MVAIVTGGANGIGKAIALAFAREGAAAVVVVDIDAPGAEETIREIASKGGRAEAAAVDLRHESAIKSMAARVLDRYGRIDVLVNDAAISGGFVDVADMDLDLWNDVMAVNLTAQMLCCREVLKPMMAARRGIIINIASEGGRSGFPRKSPYAVSKRGVIALTETLAIEVGGYGIRVNAISPGRVRGKMVETAVRNMALGRGVSEEEVMAGMFVDLSLPRFVEASEIADAAVFLASDESSAVTGHTLVVNCGKHMLH